MPESRYQRARSFACWTPMMSGFPTKLKRLSGRPLRNLKAFCYITGCSLCRENCVHAVRLFLQAFSEAPSRTWSEIVVAGGHVLLQAHCVSGGQYLKLLGRFRRPSYVTLPTDT